MGFSLVKLFGYEILGDVQLLIQTILYYVIIILGLMSCVPVGKTSQNFDGGCLLYGKIKVIESTNKEENFTIHYGDRSSCDYVITTHVLFSVLYAGGLAVLHTFVIIMRMRLKTFELVRTFMFNAVIFGINCFTTLLCFIAACVVAVGFKTFCNELLDTYSSQDSCADFQTWIKWEKHDGSSFHKSYSLSTTCCWLVTIVWVVQSCMNGLTLYKQKEAGQRFKSPASTPASTPTSGISSLAKF